jgi:NTE family protein
VLAGTYWGIGSSTERYGEPTAGYSADLVESVISTVRTDLDAFSEAEAAVLENHGYLLADVAVRKHALDLAAPGAPPAKVPHPEWLDEARVRVALADSSQRRVLGRSGRA